MNICFSGAWWLPRATETHESRLNTRECVQKEEFDVVYLPLIMVCQRRMDQQGEQKLAAQLGHDGTACSAAVAVDLAGGAAAHSLDTIIFIFIHQRNTKSVWLIDIRDVTTRLLYSVLLSCSSSCNMYSGQHINLPQ